jgi:hypothetical protein
LRNWGRSFSWKWKKAAQLCTQTKKDHDPSHAQERAVESRPLTDCRWSQHWLLVPLAECSASCLYYWQIVLLAACSTGCLFYWQTFLLADCSTGYLCVIHWYTGRFTDCCIWFTGHSAAWAARVHTDLLLLTECAWFTNLFRFTDWLNCCIANSLTGSPSAWLIHLIWILKAVCYTRVCNKHAVLCPYLQRACACAFGDVEARHFPGCLCLWLLFKLKQRSPYPGYARMRRYTQENSLVRSNL